MVIVIIIVIINMRVMTVIYLSSAMCQALGQILTHIFSNTQNNRTDRDNHFLF